MAGKKMIGCLLILAMFMVLDVTKGQLSATTITQMRTGLKDLQTALDYGATLLEKLKPMAGALGMFGAFLTFAMLFVPSKESAEMKFMRQEFGQINLKLDRISSQLDNVEALVKLEAQRAQYVASANKILFSYDQLNKFQDEISSLKFCSTETNCEKERLSIASRYVNSFNIKENLYEIMRGTSGPGTIFGDPLLDLVNSYHHCDIKKVYDFANGVIRLAFKGQYVLLAHEKLIGSNYSITSAMKDWSQMSYNIRTKADDIKLQCYMNIYDHIKTDVEDSKYQTGFESNLDAANALKSFLDKKYPWVLWTVLSYGAYGGTEHWGYETFRNMPKEGRKRVLRVIASDDGTYTSQTSTAQWIKSTIQNSVTYNDAESEDAHELFDKIRENIGAATDNKLLSLVVLTHVTDLKVATERSIFILNEVVSKKRPSTSSPYLYMWPYLIDKRGASADFRIWAMFASDEQITGVHHQCGSCDFPNTCEQIPLTSKSYCHCANFFYGDNCQHYDTIGLASNIENMLTVTTRIPNVIDVYFELQNIQNMSEQQNIQNMAELQNIQNMSEQQNIQNIVELQKLQNMQTHLAMSLHNIEDFIAKLQSTLNKKLTEGFQWTNFVTQYTSSFGELTYYLKRFETLNQSNDAQRKTLATSVVRPDGVQKWLFDLNLMIVGRQDILSSQPLIFILIQRNKNEVCNKHYKEIIDTAWKRLITLQTQAYIMWATSLSILQQPSDGIVLMHQQSVLRQTNFMTNNTCQITISNSNVTCSGGYYLFPDISLQTKCDEGHYLVGNSKVNCNKPAICRSCDCDQNGSLRQECEEQTGKCTCKNLFYGNKCNKFSVHIPTYTGLVVQK